MSTITDTPRQTAQIGPTRRLAAWIADGRELPGAVLEAARSALLDNVGAALHGSGTKWAAIVRDWVLSVRPAGEATIWGSPAMVRTCEAALANGVAAHAFELDDYHTAKLHPGAVVVPAALAVAQHAGADGRAILRAIALGYEVAIRTARALGSLSTRARGWHITGVACPIGAAAAAASLLRLDAEQTAWALGLAGTQSSGLFAFNADGAMSKRFHAGHAARSGVVAAELAARGFTGPTALFEAPDGGMLAAFSDEPQPQNLLEGLGERFHSLDVCVKPYSCCGSTHSYIDAARALRARPGFDLAKVERVRIGLGRSVRLQCGFPYVPSTALSAQMNLAYCVAVALRDGTALPPQFSDENLASPDLLRTIERTDLVDDAHLDRVYPEHFAAWVAIVLDGVEHRVDVEDPSGSPQHPLDRAGIEEKVRALLGAAAAERLSRAVLSLEADASALFETLSTPKRG